MTICACAVNRRERFTALAFSAINGFFYVVGADIDGCKGYLMTSIFDSFCAICIYIVFLHSRSNLSLYLLYACGLSVLINCYGFMAYMNYSSPEIYDSLFELYYLVLVLLFITRWRDYGRYRGIDRRSLGVFNRNNDNSSAMREGTFR